MQRASKEDTVEGETRAPVEVGLPSDIIPVFSWVPGSSCIFSISGRTHRQKLLKLLRTNIHIAENHLGAWTQALQGCAHLRLTMLLGRGPRHQVHGCHVENTAFANSDPCEHRRAI